MVPQITDKFGKASANGGNAPATTVRTARLSGEDVLPAFDVSNYTVDSPLFFVTYKKVTDPTTGVAKAIDIKSWKGIVNRDNNTITDLVLADGYVDNGNDEGDYIEPMATAFWCEELIDGILRSLNPDGSLKVLVQDPGWLPMTGREVTEVTPYGNHSYKLKFDDEVASVLSPGMRLRTERTVAAPTQSTSLNGTNQYFSKSSPAGMTFTDDFVVSAWVKLSSYAYSHIMSRSSGASGWQLTVNGDGTVRLTGLNGGSGNNSSIYTYQSLPLNKWVHITAQLDMSAFTATSTTSYVMFDGVDVPSYVNRFGTNPTALVQAGNLEVGAAAGVSFFPGKIAQAAVFSAKQTQATMLGYMHQGLTGSEPNLVCAYSFDGALNDLSPNGNHLTANGGATADEADSPFGTQGNGTIDSKLDHSIVQQVSGTDVIVQVAEGCTIPTSGGVASVSYSSYEAPYGFPKDKGKWAVVAYYKTSEQKPTPGSSVVSFKAGITLPIGSWGVSLQMTMGLGMVATGNTTGMLALSETSTSVEQFALGLSFVRYVNSPQSQYWMDRMTMESADTLRVESNRRLYLTGRGDGNTNMLEIRNDFANGGGFIRADNAYL